MRLPKLNGKVDFEMLADLMLNKILFKADICNDTTGYMDRKTKQELEKFIQDVLIEVNKHK